MSKPEKVADKVAAKPKQVAAEVVGDGKLDEDGKQQEKRTEEKDKSKPNLARIANNLT